MADPSVTIRIRGRGLVKLARQFERLDAAASRTTRAFAAMPVQDTWYDRAVEKAHRRSVASRPKRTRHGRQHPTR